MIIMRKTRQRMQECIRESLKLNQSIYAKSVSEAITIIKVYLSDVKTVDSSLMPVLVENSSYEDEEATTEMKRKKFIAVFCSKKIFPVNMKKDVTVIDFSCFGRKK